MAKEGRWRVVDEGRWRFRMSCMYAGKEQQALSIGC